MDIEVLLIDEDFDVSVVSEDIELDFGDGMDGAPGWSPVFAIEADGARRVLKVVDWIGSWGAMPDVDVYVGLTGFVTDIADGVDIRGPAGGGGGGGGVDFATIPEALNNQDAIDNGSNISDAWQGLYKIAEGSDVSPRGAIFQVY